MQNVIIVSVAIGAGGAGAVAGIVVIVVCCIKKRRAAKNKVKPFDKGEFESEITSRPMKGDKTKSSDSKTENESE